MFLPSYICKLDLIFHISLEVWEILSITDLDHYNKTRLCGAFFIGMFLEHKKELNF